MGRASFSARHHTIVAVAAVLTAATSSVFADYTSVILYPLTPPATIAQGPYATSAAGSQVTGYGYDSSGSAHAVLWEAGSAVVDLSPGNLTGFTDSYAYGTNGKQQVGLGLYSDGNYHALFWPGAGVATSASSAVDLNPAGYDGSSAQAVAGDEQVGSAYGVNTSENPHAMLWTGTAASAVDLNPSGYDESYANATDGVSQVGVAIGTTATSGNEHAALWSGTSGTFVDLNPAGFSNSYANGVSGKQQVGTAFGGTDTNLHAMLWNGTAGSAVNLSPTSLSYITDSEAYGTNGSQQVGYGIDTNGDNHALLWSSTGASAIDLQTALPTTGAWSDSTAYSINASGQIFGTADGVFAGTTGTFAIAWFATPPLLGDANLDGVVNSADYNALMTGFADGLSGWANGDFNGDGVVNADDWALFQYGLAAYQSGSSVTVPEPAIGGMISLSVLGFLARRRRCTE
jgi:hypothetical protein